MAAGPGPLSMTAIRHCAPRIAVAVVIGACGTLVVRPPQVPASEEYLIVDCLLAPRMITDPNLGAVAMPRAPVKTMAADCAARAGEYQTIDVRWSLKVWTPAAEGGDAEAQYHLGEIHERGLDGKSDFASAARWYRRAAEQGHGPAAGNLARLCELGLGVAPDWPEALKWYQVAGAYDDPRTVLDQTRVVYERLERHRRALRGELDRLHEGSREGPRSGRDGRRETCGAVVERYPVVAVQLASADAPASDPGDTKTREREIVEELRSLEDQIARMQAKIAELTEEVGKQERRRGSVRPKPQPVTRRALGKYYALVIGNDDYLAWPKLETPINDATALKSILEERYGFEKPVVFVANGNTREILARLAEIRTIINHETESGTLVNFLLFYAGHGARRYPAGDDWIPVDAPTEYSSQWIADTQIAEQVRAMKARQVLVIADSSFASTLATRGALLKDEPLTLQGIVRQQPRMVLTSGADRPVHEPGKSEHSIFAIALIDALRESRGVIKGEDLFRKIEERMHGASQPPRYLPILNGDHTSGDFILVAGD